MTTFRAARTIASAIAVTLLGVSVVACSPDTIPDGRMHVLASFYPLQFVAERVGGDLVEVTSLTPAGAEPHDLELTPAGTRTISTADLVIYLRGFQPSVDESIDARQPEHAIDAATTTQLIPLDEAGEAEEGHSHDDGHDHGALDPHFWLDPTRITGLVDAVAKEFTALSPDNSAKFKANAESFKAELSELDSAFTEGLGSCPSRSFVTTHSAFGYLALRYDLDQVGISGIDPDAEPSPARIKEVSALIREQNISTVFFETLVSPKVAETLANDLGVKTAILDPLESLADPSSNYLAVMKTNLSALQSALECK